MYKIKYKISLKTPAVISDYAGNMNTRAAIDYIPGNVILGILANILDRKDSIEEKGIISDWIISEKTLFSDALLTYKDQPTYPVPLGFEHLKRRPAFPTFGVFEGNDVSAKIRRMTNLADWHSNNNNSPKETWKHIRSGWLTKSSQDKLVAISANKKTFTHNIIDYETQRPNEKTGGVFVYEALQANQDFSGDIRFEELSAAQAFHKTFDKGMNIRIGKSSSTQYGDAYILFSGVEKMENVQFSGNKLTLLLMSHTILKDYLGMPANQLTPAILEQYFMKNGYAGIAVKADENKIPYFNTRIIQGFNGKWGQYRTNVPAIVRGSLFHFVLEGIKIEDAVNMLLKKGIGERRQEGYGRIAIDHPLFHLFNDGTNVYNFSAAIIPEDISEDQNTTWWEISGMPEALEIAVFQKELKISIRKTIQTVFLNGDSLKQQWINNPSNSQLQGLRNVAIAAKGVNQIVAFMSAKQDKKAYKEGQWENKIRIPTTSLENEFQPIYVLFTAGINEAGKFYSFLGQTDLPEKYKEEKYLLLAVKLFIAQWVTTIIKLRD